MISSSMTVRAATREPQPPVPATGYETPQDANDAGWLGQVPPATVPRAMPRRCTAFDVDAHAPLTGHESAEDAREGGWLGQVPPPPTPPRCPPAPTSGGLDEIELGDETPQELHERGWLGQVPPPPAAPPAPVHDAPAPTYANPQLAPDPWLDPGALYPDDPTLFG